MTSPVCKCAHGKCKICNKCHNFDCDLSGIPTIKCYDQLLPKEVKFCECEKPEGYGLTEGFCTFCGLPIRHSPNMTEERCCEKGIDPCPNKDKDDCWIPECYKRRVLKHKEGHRMTEVMGKVDKQIGGAVRRLGSEGDVEIQLAAEMMNVLAEKKAPNTLCNGAHCKCFNVDGQCSNNHYADCVVHNPTAIKAPNTEAWEIELDNKWYLHTKHSTYTTEYAYVTVGEEVKQFIRELLLSEKNKAREAEYEKGYNDGESSRAADWSCKLDEHEKEALEEARQIGRNEAVDFVMERASQIHDPSTLRRVLEAARHKEV